jgi:DNA-binding response OmpR family regulator
VAEKYILILEDDELAGPFFASVLTGAGHEVLLCTSFEQAREELRHRLPAGLLTDVRVGEYNGLQLALMFRSLAPVAPILVVSGHDDEVIKSEARSLGASFLLKPFDAEELRAHFSSEFLSRAVLPPFRSQTR